MNLSSGGLFIACDDAMPVDTRLSLQVDFPRSGKRMTCRGRVAWLNHSESGRKKPHLPTGMGVQFDQLAREQLNMVKGYLASSL